MNLYEVAMEIARRLTRIFLRIEEGRRPVYGVGLRSSRPTRTDVTTSSSMSTSTATTAQASGRVTRRGGRVVAKLIQMLGSLDSREVQEGDTRPSMKIYYQRTGPVSK